LKQLTEQRSKPPVEVAKVDAPPSCELMVLKERNVQKAFEGLKLRMRHSYRTYGDYDGSAEVYLAGVKAAESVALNAGELQ
jgi:hypothetical protein